MPVRIVRLGTPRHTAEGLRFGTVLRPPRGGAKSQYAKRDWFDVWLPNLSPSPGLMRNRALAGDSAGWRRFERRFQAELRQPDRAHVLDALAALSHVANFSVGCYCEDEDRCHRSVLRRELRK